MGSRLADLAIDDWRRLEERWNRSRLRASINTRAGSIANRIYCRIGLVFAHSLVARGM